VYKEAMLISSLDQLINKGNIKFIPNKRDPKIIINWRSITMLNVTYKIISKALSLKLKPLLPLIIHLEQTCFVKGRYILDNVIVVWEGMESRSIIY